MKLYKSFLLGGLAMLAASCAEDVAPSIPQSNPQEPIFEAGDVQVSADGVFGSQAAGTVLDLEQYKADGKIPVFILDKADDLPTGGTVSFKVELSDTPDFARTQTLDTFTADLSRDGGVQYYASADAWNEAHVYLFGKSPKEKTVYYRVPGYLDIDGSDYRLNSVDTYLVSGTLKETCFDMGFVIEDAYYFLGDATTWDLGAASAFQFYHNPDVSPYDDPVFTYVVSIAEGDCCWKIAPQSAVDSGSWNNVIGVETDRDSSLEGHLVGGNPGAGKIAQPGRYEITINMESMTYSIKQLENVVYLIGAPQGWNVGSDALALAETAHLSNIYSGIVKVDTGKFQFRFYSQTGDWDKGSIGSQNDDKPVDITFDADGVFEGDLYQGGVNCTNGKGSWQVADWADGAVEITLDLNTMKITMKKVSVNSGIYLRGGMNGWNADPAYEFILTDKVSTWAVSDLKLDGGVKFKVADASWGAVNLGAGSVDTIVAGEEFPLDGGSDIALEADFSGKAVLTKIGESYTLTLEAE